MNTTISWIKAYVPELSCTDQEYCDAMTMSGTKVESFEALDKNLDLKQLTRNIFLLLSQLNDFPRISQSKCSVKVTIQQLRYLPQFLF